MCVGTFLVVQNTPLAFLASLKDFYYGQCAHTLIMAINKEMGVPDLAQIFAPIISQFGQELFEVLLLPQKSANF